MPLDADYPVRTARPLDALYCAIGGASGDAQVIAGLVNGLVVAAVDLARRCAIESG